MPFDVGVGDAAGPLRQRNQELGQLVGDFRQISAEVVDEHGEGFAVDRAPPGGDVLRQPASDLIVARAHGFQHPPARETGFVELRAFVHRFLLMADDQHGRGRGLGRVECELVEPAHLLRLLHYDHFARTHHGHLTAEIDHLSGLGVAPVNGDLVEGLLRLREDRRGELPAQGVDEIGLLAHEQIDRCELPFGRFGREAFVGRHGVFEFYAAAGHG